MRSLFFLLILSSSLFAVDVSDFEIKGIKLGMSKKEVLKKMPCTNPKTNVYKIEGKLVWSEFSCKLDKNSYDPDFHVMLNQHNRVIYIDRTKRFNVTPLWEKVKQNLLNHYGSKGVQSINKNNVAPFQLCWGECVTKNSGKFFDPFIEEGQPLLNIEAYYNIGYKPYMTFIFTNPTKSKENKEWKELLEKKEEEHKREKASNIDF